MEAATHVVELFVYLESLQVQSSLGFTIGYHSAVKFSAKLHLCDSTRVTSEVNFVLLRHAPLTALEKRAATHRIGTAGAAAP